MSSDLLNVTKSIVDNLHQTWLYRAIEELCRKDALELREQFDLASFSITTSDSIERYNMVKKNLLSKRFHDDATLEFLMDAPRWAGFALDEDEFQSSQQVIGAARTEVIALLWLMAIPRLIISPIMSPEEYPSEGIKQFISDLMTSDESRALLVNDISKALESRGIHDVVFEPNPIGKGYSIDDALRLQRIQSLVAMIMMHSTKYPFDIDRIFVLGEKEIIEETTAYIVSMHAKSMLKTQINGAGVQRPFDWPLIGNPKICSNLFTTLDVLKQSAQRMTTCSKYTSETAQGRAPWGNLEFTSFLLNEITEYYSEVHRLRHGKSKNIELDLFIKLLTLENNEIAERILETDDFGSSLYAELNKYKQKAKSGEQPQITPERRFRVILSNLKQRVSEEVLAVISSEEVIEKVIEPFDAIVDVVESHKKSFGEESERFTQALCFETAYRILKLLNIGGAIMDLPWVSRFIAEESARSYISTGEISNLDDEHRIRRIVSAYAGGLTYLVLQYSN